MLAMLGRRPLRVAAHVLWSRGETAPLAAAARTGEPEGAGTRSASFRARRGMSVTPPAGPNKEQMD